MSVSPRRKERTLTSMANNEPENQGPKQPSSIPIPKSKRGMKGFFTDVNRELKKVNWPSRPETNRLTGVVLAVCVMMAVLLLAMGEVAQTFVSLITKGTVS